MPIDRAAKRSDNKESGGGDTGECTQGKARSEAGWGGMGWDMAMVSLM